jgi:hypothetical protein
MAVNCYVNYQHVVAQNVGLRREIIRLNTDHTVVMDHLGRAQGREHLWRQQIRLLRREVERLREHVRRESRRRLTDRQKEVLRQLVSQIDPLPVQQWLLCPHPELTSNDDLFQVIVDRRQFQALVELCESSSH